MVNGLPVIYGSTFTLYISTYDGIFYTNFKMESDATQYLQIGYKRNSNIADDIGSNAGGNDLPIINCGLYMITITNTNCARCIG